MSPFTPGFVGIRSETAFRSSVNKILKGNPLFNGFKVAERFAEITKDGVEINQNSTQFLLELLPIMITIAAICQHNEEHLKYTTLPLSKVFRGETLEPIILLGCMIHIILTKIQKEDPNFRSNLVDLLSRSEDLQSSSRFLTPENFESLTPMEKFSTIMYYLSLFVHRSTEEPSLNIAADHLYLLTHPSREIDKQ